MPRGADLFLRYAGCAEAGGARRRIRCLAMNDAQGRVEYISFFVVKLERRESAVTSEIEPDNQTQGHDYENGPPVHTAVAVSVATIDRN